MRFAHPWWLFGTALALAVGIVLAVGGYLLVRATRRFGDEERIATLVTENAAARRALKGVILVAAVAFGFVALAQPQYGRGTRLVPATNLDTVIVLDYSKSMYARDVTPSRIERAKVEVGRLIADLPGARFGAVAFAGEPMSFPLTSDGGAIAQFFRQLSPSDMPVGGTAIARALEQGMDLFRRDPVSARHKRIIVLVTDGEDLEGDPVAVAESAAKEHVTVHVVQIGGRSPEPIPNVDDRGNVVGWRKDENGQPLTTSLSASGEEQLAKIAQATGGNVVRSEHGATGIDEIASSMKKMMSAELSERVETVYADVYIYPTALALVLLVVEAFVSEAARRKQRAASPPPRTRTAGKRAAGTLAALLFVVGCHDGPFMRNAPAVDDALTRLDAGDPKAATELLESYLSTGECKNGEIGTPESVKTKENASFDLGLALFKVAERFGGRFGEDPKSPSGPGVPAPPGAAPDDRRAAEIDCALRVVRMAAADGSGSAEFKARAEYLAGNLEFLRQAYEDAVVAYDVSLKLSPAKPGEADSVAARAAWNRAIALRRIEDRKQPDAGTPPPDHQDGGPPKTSPDAGNGQSKNDDKDKNQDQKDDKKNPSNDKNEPDDKKNQNEQKQAENKPENPPKPSPSDDQRAQKPPSGSANQDERMLDDLEQAPTVQEEHAKRNAARARVVGMEDK